jgi:hypothetical protein
MKAQRTIGLTALMKSGLPSKKPHDLGLAQKFADCVTSFNSFVFVRWHRQSKSAADATACNA